MSVAGWWTTAVFCFAGMVSYIDRLILSVLVDPIRREMQISDYQVSLLQGIAFVVVYVLAGLPLGRLADRHRRLTILLIGSTVWCAGVVMCGLAPDFWTLFAGRLLVGVGEATLFPAGVSLLSDAVPTQWRGTAVGIFMMGTILGAPAAVLFGGVALELAQQQIFAGVPLLNQLSDWRQVLVVIGVLGFSVPLLFLTLREPARSGKASADVSLGAAVSSFVARGGVLLPLYIGLALLAVGDYGLVSWMPSLLSRKFEFSPATLGVWIGTVTAIAGVVGSVGGGIITDWVGRKGGVGAQFRLLAISALTAGIAATFVSGPSAMLALAGLALWTFASAIAITSGLAALQSIAPHEHRGVSISLVAFCNTLLGLGVGPSLIALLTENVLGRPEAVGFAMTSVVAPAGVLAALLFFAARGRASRAS